MKKFSLSAIFLFFSISFLHAQVPIVYYDFDLNSSRTTFENAVEQSVNSGGSSLTRIGNNPTISGGVGAAQFNGGASGTTSTTQGLAISGGNWQNITTDPGTLATNYYQFVTSTTGFSGISISFDDFTSATGPGEVGVLWSTDGTNFNSSSVISTTNGVFGNTGLFYLGSGANNSISLTIRIYAYAGSRSGFSGSGTLRIDNLTIYASSITASKTLLDYPAIGTSLRANNNIPYIPTYSDLEVNAASSIVNLNTTLQLQGTLTLTNGTLNTNNALTLKSTSTNTSRVATVTAGSITGNVTVERFIPATGRKFRMLAPQTTGTQTIRQAWQENGAVVNNLGTWITSNVANAVSNGFDDVSQSPSILVWDNTIGSTNSWYDRSVDNTNSKQLSSEPGYLLFVRGDRTATPANSINNVTTLRSTGSLRVGPQTTTVVGTASNGAERYTLVDNPYASPIDFEQVFTNASTTNIKPLFWIWDARRSGLGGYTLIRRTGTNTYEAVPSPFGAGNDSTTTALQHIQSGQAFFVEPVSTSGGQVFIEENDKSAVTYNSIFKTSGSTMSTFRINLLQKNGDNTELTDGVMAAYSSDYTAGIDADDVSKLNNFGENISLARGAKNLTFESRPIISSQDTLFLNITNTTQRDYELAFKADNFNASGVSAFLEDRFLKTKTPVSLSEITKINFSITSDPASADVNRFDVLFQANSILPVNFTNIKAYRKDQGIQVEWNVASENDINHYEVEKSVDGRQFASAVSINATRTNVGPATYNWIDVTGGSNDNYYRIKATSNTGSIILSSIVKVNSLKGKGSIVVYPNPVFNKNLSLQFSNQPAGKYNIQLFNNNGQQVFNKSIEHQEGSSTQTLQLGNNVTKGVYQLKISNGGNTITQKIICN